VCFQQSVDRISKSHSARNTVTNQSRNTEGMFHAAEVRLFGKVNKLCSYKGKHYKSVSVSCSSHVLNLLCS